ncbi:lambda-exonuclease family protein [Polynucleobacter sp.]|uniref:YqaJ viral recombinase family nuclease n=1 Tax=Polynucleobacter sp. TaxID=2029855 RepID=UPI0026161B1A|nr:YqaJ viral recombinase family protein [Polynucleobacter sp.]MCW1966049.1 YqaJ viral recombinase family protein [Polynucleobacter sp.]
MLNNQHFTQDRTKYLGGSDIGAILGFSKYRTALDVWLEKTGRVVSKVDNLPVRFGSFAESFVASEYASQTGFSLVHSEAGVVHPRHPFMVGHIDRFVFERSSDINRELFHSDGSCAASHLLECKTASPFNQSDWGELGTDEVPMSYLVQCLWYLAITNLERCDVAVLFGNSDFRIYEVYRDQELEELIVSKAAAFWHDYVQIDTPPPAQCESDYQHLFSKEITGTAVEADSTVCELTQKLQLLNSEIKSKELEVSQIKQTIMGQMGEAELLTYQGKVLATWKSPKTSYRLDSKRLELEHPELIPQYQVPILTSRRLVIKELTTK